MKTFNEFMNEKNTYDTIAETPKYSLVKAMGGFRIENHKGFYSKQIPYMEIPKQLFEQLLDYLINYKSYDMTKSEGRKEFYEICDNMFDEEHTELYPSSVK